MKKIKAIIVTALSIAIGYSFMIGMAALSVLNPKMFQIAEIILWGVIVMFVCMIFQQPDQEELELMDKKLERMKVVL